MSIIGYHASHEQFTPAELLQLVQLAEKAGFGAAMSSDHFNPWSLNQGSSGNAWSWLGAALQATKFNYASLAIPGGYRYHPALLAQTIATLAEMFPGRIPWIAAGSGEALNETFIDPHWPQKSERNQRLLEGVNIMKSLWSGELVHRPDGLLPTYNAKLWNLPKPSPKIYGAALTSRTAEWAGGWADGLITVAAEESKLEKMVSAFRSGGGQGKPLVLQVHVSWGQSLEKAQANAIHQWKNNACEGDDLADLRTVEEFDQRSKDIGLKEVANKVLISIDPEEYITKLKGYQKLGFDEIHLHNVGRNQKEFIEFFGKNILPVLGTG